MSSIVVNDKRYPLVPGATVLDTLLDAGLHIPFGCRAGACQSCLLRASAGSIPPEAQQGLKETLKADGWFLACCCNPDGELTIDLSAGSAQTVSARVVEKRLLSPRVMGLWLETDTPFEYRPGQYLNLYRDKDVARSYSLASMGEDGCLELHIARIDGGSVSSWVHNELQVGDEVLVSGPKGECFYVEGKPEQPLLFVGTGTGLAPLYGILRDALRKGHSGPVHLFHGARTVDYLYYQEQLRLLGSRHENLEYHPSVTQAEEPAVPRGVTLGLIDKLVTEHLPKLEGWRVYLSGAPDMVSLLRKRCFLAGAASKEIFTDPFG